MHHQQSFQVGCKYVGDWSPWQARFIIHCPFFARPSQSTSRRADNDLNDTSCNVKSFQIQAENDLTILTTWWKFPFSLANLLLSFCSLQRTSCAGFDLQGRDKIRRQIPVLDVAACRAGSRLMERWDTSAPNLVHAKVLLRKEKVDFLCVSSQQADYVDSLQNKTSAYVELGMPWILTRLHANVNKM